MRGPSHLDKTRQQEIRERIRTQFGITDAELNENMTAVDTGLVAEFLVSNCGYQKSLEPFMVSGAPVVRWTKAVKKDKAPVQIGEL